jgi:flagellar operon protein
LAWEIKITQRPRHKKREISKILAQLKISNHAQKRMSARKLNLADDDYVQISKAVSELQEKGSRESLLLYKDMGLIANVQNRTIITAMDMNEIGTVTNIDSTKFIK